MHVALIKILQQIQIILNKLRKSFSRFEDSYLTTNSTPFTGYRFSGFDIIFLTRHFQNIFRRTFDSVKN